MFAEQRFALTFNKNLESKPLLEDLNSLASFEGTAELQRALVSLAVSKFREHGWLSEDTQVVEEDRRIVAEPRRIVADTHVEEEQVDRLLYAIMARWHQVDEPVAQLRECSDEDWECDCECHCGQYDCDYCYEDVAVEDVFPCTPQGNATTPPPSDATLLELPQGAASVKLTVLSAEDTDIPDGLALRSVDDTTFELLRKSTEEGSYLMFWTQTWNSVERLGYVRAVKM